MTKILYVDNDPLLREIMCAYLQSFGYMCETAEHAEAGLKFLEESSCHLVMTVFKLPGKNGLEFCGEIRKRKPSLPCIIISAFEDVSEIVRINNNGAACFISKSARLSELKEAIGTAFSGGTKNGGRRK